MIDELVDYKNVHLKDISELERFFIEKNISQEKTRFFINEDLDEPRCFGIYQDSETGNFVVYKNKSDGSRFVRYNGNSEKEAVSIFFDKLKEEMKLRENKNTKSKKRKKNNRALIAIIVIAILWTIATISIVVSNIYKNRNNGYYFKDNTYYYRLSNNWYYYDSHYDDWYYYDGIIDNNYYIPDYSTSVIKPFEDTEYYEDYYDSDNSYSDSDFDDYDFDSWDSSDTDWGSDW